ncbi:hypothetical protein [Caenispirillum bisanense]|uniref:Uncharacterized protein n=1 Tax=Caenispirillum bisanense TaxID=414052 RepID=A0A286GM92_9PROT|nr:hypothetical protein [Caenispirillum bisanense]SOD96647.1 hypothetical protein SAMN05421508_10621 [Caenispirillum bisanense]
MMYDADQRGAERAEAEAAAASLKAAITAAMESVLADLEAEASAAPNRVVRRAIRSKGRRIKAAGTKAHRVIDAMLHQGTHTLERVHNDALRLLSDALS